MLKDKKKRKMLMIAGGVVITIILLITGKKIFGAPKYESAIAEKVETTENLKFSGRVKAASEANLGFEQSGKVSAVRAKVGQKVVAGTVLVELEHADLSAQLLRTQARLSAEQSRLEEVLKGTREEEIKIAETAVTNAQSDLADAKSNLDVVTTKATADSEKSYSDLLNETQKSATVAKNSLITISELQDNLASASDNDRRNIADTKGRAVYALFNRNNFGYSDANSISQLDGGLFTDIKNTSLTDKQAITDRASLMEDVLNVIKSALEYFPVNSLNDTQKTTLATEKTTIVNQISTLSSKEKSISVTITSGQSSINTAKNQVTSTENALAKSKDELALKKAGATPQAIAAARSNVKSAEADVAEANAKVQERILKSPINGLVSKLDATLGEIIPANQAVVGVLSDNKFEIEAYVSELDVAKISVGQTASSTSLDAYGEETYFPAGVVEVEPAETIQEGLPKYKVRMQFLADDSRIKSGMTANVTLPANVAVQQIVVPTGAVIKETGANTKVLVRNGDGSIDEREVTTGISTDNEKIVILKGINSGEIVLIKKS